MSRLLLCLFASLLVAACSPKTPTCADAQTIDLAKQLVNEALLKELVTPRQPRDLVDQFLKQVNVDISTIRTTAKDDRVGKHICEATLTIAYAPLAATPKAQPGGKPFELSDPIEYSTQLTDVDKRLFLQMSGHMATVNKFVLTLSLKGISLEGSIAPPTSAARSDLRASPAAIEQLLKLDGAAPSNVISSDFIKRDFQALLGTAFSDFESRLSISSGLSIGNEYIFASGCLPHMCGSDEAAFTVNRATGRLFAILLMDGKELRWFGDSTIKEAPRPIIDWYVEHGGKLD